MTHAGTAAKITEAATITATKVATTHILVAIIVPTPAGVAIAHAHAVAHIAHAVASHTASHTAHPRPRAAAALFHVLDNAPAAVVVGALEELDVPRADGLPVFS